jgi:hypothetical protein
VRPQIKLFKKLLRHQAQGREGVSKISSLVAVKTETATVP